MEEKVERNLYAIVDCYIANGQKIKEFSSKNLQTRSTACSPQTWPQLRCAQRRLDHADEWRVRMCVVANLSPQY